MEKWIALLIVMALFRPLVWGGLVLLLWAISKAVLSERAGRRVCGHFWDRKWRDVFTTAIAGEDQARPRR